MGFNSVFKGLIQFIHRNSQTQCDIWTQFKNLELSETKQTFQNAADVTTCFVVIREHFKRYYERAFKASGRDVLRYITQN